MSASAVSTPARDAISEFVQHLADRGLSASTRRIRKHYLNEYLRHAQQAAGMTAAALTAGDLMDGERAQAWLADAAAGKTRTRNTIRGPEAAAYPNSMRVRADTFNAFAEFIGGPARVDRERPARGYHLSPGDTEKLLHELTVKRPINANAMTALRTAAVASLVADTGRGVPELAELNISALHLDGDEPTVEADGETFPLTNATVHILTRWLAARAAIVADLEGSDPGHLWIPTKPGRARGGVPSAKPGINPAAVRTLHASHRALVSQLLGTPLRPGALRAAAASVLPEPASTGELPLPWFVVLGPPGFDDQRVGGGLICGQERFQLQLGDRDVNRGGEAGDGVFKRSTDTGLLLLDQHERVLVLVAEEEHQRHAAASAHHFRVHVYALALKLSLVRAGIVRAERDAGHPARLVAALRRYERDRGPAGRRRDLHPAIPLAEWLVHGHPEPELLGVEIDRLVLVGDRDEHPSERRYMRHRLFPSHCDLMAVSAYLRHGRHRQTSNQARAADRYPGFGEW